MFSKKPKIRTFADCQKNIATAIKEDAIFIPEGRMFGKIPETRYSSIFQLYRVREMGYFLQNAVYGFDALMNEHKINLSEIQITGRIWSALPIMGAITYAHPELKSFIIRRELKNYGPQNIFEGTPDPHKPVLIIDDLANSTNSLYHCKRILLGHDIPVLDKCFAILNKKNEADLGFLWDKYSDQEIISIISRDMVT